MKFHKRCQSDRQMKNRTAGTIFDRTFVAEELYDLDSAAVHLKTTMTSSMNSNDRAENIDRFNASLSSLDTVSYKPYFRGQKTDIRSG